MVAGSWKPGVGDGGAGEDGGELGEDVILDVEEDEVVDYGFVDFGWEDGHACREKIENYVW